VTLRRIDARFLLPHPVRRAAVLEGIEGWGEQLERVGVELATTGRLDLVVAPAERAGEAAALRPRAAILEGRGGRALRTASLARRTYLPLPAIDEPLVFVPHGSPGPARYAVTHWAYADSRAKRLRNELVGRLAARGLLPPLRPELIVGAQPGLPYLMESALELGVPEDVRPLLLAGQGDDYSRAAFLLFEQGSSVPSWALKFQRLPGKVPAFEREARGLAIAAETGGIVAAHAPRWLGAREVDGLQCTLETAAHGRSLLAILRSAPGRAEPVQPVCEWLLEVARATRAPSEALDEERRRLAEAVLPSWGLGSELLERLAALPAVLQHNDVGTWNVVVDGDGFTVLDWEDCVRHGLPLWDVLYLLADATAHIDGITEPADRGEHFERVFLGEAQSSALLFHWVRTMVDALAIPAEAVGPVATLCWLHHGLSGERRAEGSNDESSRDHVAHVLFRELAERWLRNPALGASWDRWR
jgi:hypothetical protein